MENLKKLEKEYLDLDDSSPKDEVFKFWKLRDGTKLEVIKMGSGHINNCIKFLQRKIVENTNNSLMHKNRYLEKWIKVFRSELENRNIAPF